MRKLITIILAVVLLLSFIKVKNDLKDAEQDVQAVKAVAMELEDTVTSLESEKKTLLKEIADMKVDNDDLKDQMASIQNDNKDMDKAYKELEIAYQNEYPDIGVTLKNFVKNFEYLTANVDNFKGKGLKLPQESELLKGVDGRNFNTRYHIEPNNINYRFNIGGRINKNNILKMRMSYNNITQDEQKAKRIKDYTEAILSAYFMTLENTMEYTDAISEAVLTLMETGNYTKGDFVMKCSFNYYNGFTYIKNRHGLLSIFD
jgi:hypothetical protein